MGTKRDVDDRFKKFGTVSFTSVSKVNDFIDHLEADRISGTRCTGCGTEFFPPRADCCRCLDSRMEWFDITGTGKLVTFARLKFAPIGFENDLPYCIALVDYGNYKIFGRLADHLRQEEIAVGMAVRARVNTLPNGQLNYVFEKA
jgi:uncharacterized OB-fold protein